jgi:hypothetical protein
LVEPKRLSAKSAQRWQGVSTTASLRRLASAVQRQILAGAVTWATLTWAMQPRFH